MFIITWLPYAYVCVYRTLWGGTGLSPFMSSLPAMIAKSSMMWPPLFFILFNKKIHEAFIALIIYSKEAKRDLGNFIMN